jgi:hypothetical protein
MCTEVHHPHKLTTNSFRIANIFHYKPPQNNKFFSRPRIRALLELRLADLRLTVAVVGLSDAAWLPTTSASRRLISVLRREMAPVEQEVNEESDESNAVEVKRDGWLCGLNAGKSFELCPGLADLLPSSVITDRYRSREFNPSHPRSFAYSVHSSLFFDSICSIRDKCAKREFFGMVSVVWLVVVWRGRLLKNMVGNRVRVRHIL